VGPAATEELAKLQDAVPPFPNEVAFRLMEEELGVKPTEIFSEISEKPVAAASLAQVVYPFFHNTCLILAGVVKSIPSRYYRPQLSALLDRSLLTSCIVCYDRFIRLVYAPRGRW